MIHCHSACQDAHSAGIAPALGPYFPKRAHGGGTIKASTRPPRPMLQMAFPHLGQETSKVCLICKLSHYFKEYFIYSSVNDYLFSDFRDKMKIMTDFCKNFMASITCLWI